MSKDEMVYVSKEKPVIIHHNKEAYIERKITESGIKVKDAYKKSNKLLIHIRNRWFKYKFPFDNIWYNKDLKQLKTDTIIVWDPVMTANFVKWISELHPDKRIIFWYWNPVRKSVNPELLSDNVCEKWTYSLNDCKKYGLNYNTTFYFKELAVDNKNLDYDIYFVGKDKERLNQLLNLRKKFVSLNLKIKFHITPTKKYMKMNNSIYKDPISYDKVLVDIGKSKAILDLLVNPNDGISLRPMESIFHKKKLITNSKFIKEYDFYRPENIFILGEDNLKDLHEFINSPYKNIDDKIISKYDFRNWLSRF